MLLGLFTAVLDLHHAKKVLISGLITIRHQVPDPHPEQPASLIPGLARNLELPPRPLRARVVM
jgi:hypothetical protein